MNIKLKVKMVVSDFRFKYFDIFIEYGLIKKLCIGFLLKIIYYVLLNVYYI